MSLDEVIACVRERAFDDKGRMILFDWRAIESFVRMAYTVGEAHNAAETSRSFDEAVMEETNAT
jgi:hypothetical protein